MTNNHNRFAGIRHLFTATLLTMGAFAINASADIKEVIEKSYAFDRDGRVSLENINGDVTITACNCDTVDLKATIIASSQEMRERIQVDINHSESRLSIKTRYLKDNENRHYSGRLSVDYELSVPNDVRLDDIDLVNGNLEIEGVTGSLDADLVNGELNSDGLTASTRVDMVNGNMELRFANLENAETISLQSVNGNIKVYLPDDANATIDAETISGSIRNDFGLKVNRHRYVGSDLRGTLGNGNVRIDLENVNGGISVKRM